MRLNAALNPAQARELCDRYRKGASVIQLAVDFSTSVPTIYKYLRRGGVMDGVVLRTKVSQRQYRQICTLAAKHSIGVELWLHSLIVDALAEENPDGTNQHHRSEGNSQSGEARQGKGALA